MKPSLPPLDTIAKTLNPSPSTYMARALTLAREVLGATSPNPAVGCVLVKDGRIIAEGATQPPGGPHAEKVALAKAGANARGSTMYVSLEPCCHFGRTPPCTAAIIEAGVAAVHFALLDPNLRVSGKGRAELDAAGIATYLGDGAEEARELNEGFLKWIRTGHPFVHAKFAMSLDGKIATATGDSRWISGDASRALVHAWRRAADAILVGANTVRRDNPRLTARTAAGLEASRQPLRVVVDTQARLAPDAALLRPPGQVLIAIVNAAPASNIAALEAAGAELLVLPRAPGGVDLVELLRLLGERSITSIIVEGGGTLLASLLEVRLIDKLSVFIAPLLIGGKEAPTAIEGHGIARLQDALRLQRLRVQPSGADTLITGYLGET